MDSPVIIASSPLELLKYVLVWTVELVLLGIGAGIGILCLVLPGLYLFGKAMESRNEELRKAQEEYNRRANPEKKEATKGREREEDKERLTQAHFPRK